MGVSGEATWLLTTGLVSVILHAAAFWSSSITVFFCGQFVLVVL